MTHLPQPEPYLGIAAGSLPIPSEASLDALMKDDSDVVPVDDDFDSLEDFDGHPYTAGCRVLEHRLFAPFKKYWGKPAPAHPSSLAGLILRNLAYAPVEERYDHLLLEDAKRKAKLVIAYAEHRRNMFEQALARFKAE